MVFTFDITVQTSGLYNVEINKILVYQDESNLHRVDPNCYRVPQWSMGMVEVQSLPHNCMFNHHHMQVSRRRGEGGGLCH